MPSFSMRAVVDDFVASMLPFDESVRVSHIDWCECQDAMPPTLYVDDWTVLREVVNPYTLRAGDHCIVSVNVLHNNASTKPRSMMCWKKPQTPTANI